MYKHHFTPFTFTHHINTNLVEIGIIQWFLRYRISPELGWWQAHCQIFKPFPLESLSIILAVKFNASDIFLQRVNAVFSNIVQRLTHNSFQHNLCMRGGRSYKSPLIFPLYEEVLEGLVLSKAGWYSFSGLGDIYIKPIIGWGHTHFLKSSTFRCPSTLWFLVPNSNLLP